MERVACPVERSKRSRRDLLKLLPLGAAGLLIEPTGRGDLTKAVLALHHAASAAFSGCALAPCTDGRQTSRTDKR